MFWRKKKREIERRSYDASTKRPVVLVSICTGEKTAGFQDLKTKKVDTVMLVNTEEAMEEFLAMYGLRRDQVKEIW